VGKADFRLVDLTNRWMMPARDPPRLLGGTAVGRTLHDVFIDELLLVDRSNVPALDHVTAMEALTVARAYRIAAVSGHDPA
jgi:hypothetical protein